MHMGHPGARSDINSNKFLIVEFQGNLLSEVLSTVRIVLQLTFIIFLPKHCINFKKKNCTSIISYVCITLSFTDNFQVCDFMEASHRPVNEKGCLISILKMRKGKVGSLLDTHTLLTLQILGFAKTQVF